MPKKIAQFVEIDLELISPLAKRGRVIRYAGIYSLTETNKFGTSAVEPIVEGPEMQTRQQTLELLDMVWSSGLQKDVD